MCTVTSCPSANNSTLCLLPNLDGTRQSKYQMRCHFRSNSHEGSFQPFVSKKNGQSKPVKDQDLTIITRNTQHHPQYTQCTIHRQGNCTQDSAIHSTTTCTCTWTIHTSIIKALKRQHRWRTAHPTSL